MIPVFIPYKNRPDLLSKAIDSVGLNNETQVVVINNSGEKLDVLYQQVPPVPLNFSQTQEWMLKLAEEVKAPFYLFMHSDAEAEEGSVQRLVDMAHKLDAEETKWSVIFTNYDALAAFNTKAFRTVGGWDTFLTWYASECDMYYRLRCGGYPTIDSDIPVKHTPSQTLNSDPYIRMCVDMEFPFREAYYRAKHGGPIGKETYTIPFNGMFQKGESGNG